MLILHSENKKDSEKKINFLIIIQDIILYVMNYGWIHFIDQIHR